MYCYAQLENGVCVAVSQLKAAVTAENMIPLDFADNDKLNRQYLDGEWLGKISSAESEQEQSDVIGGVTLATIDARLSDLCADIAARLAALEASVSSALSEINAIFGGGSVNGKNI